MADAARSILDALDQAPAAVAIIGGPDLLYSYFNEEFHRLVPGVQVGTRFGVHTPQGEKFRALISQVATTGKALQLQSLAVVLQNGTTVYFDVLMHPLREGGVIVVGTNVTAAVEARRELALESDRTRRAEAQLNAVLEHAPMFVVTFDRAARILFIAGGEITRRGQSPAEFTGRSALELFGSDPAVTAVVRRAMTGDRFTALVPRPGGVTYEIHYTPVRDKNGELDFVVAAGIDVSGRLRAEEERARIQEKMLQSQKLESLGVLAGGIAHDFNNLLTVIQGNAAVALGRVEQAHPAREMLDDILIATQRAADLTRQMLAYSGRGRFEIKPLDLREQVGQIANLLRNSISKKVALRIERPESLPHVQGDASQMQQVVMNLLLNAAESMDERGGEVLVRLAEESIGGEGGGDLIGRDRLAEGRYVVLTVEDNGLGMDAKIQARIFDPFFTTKATGRGLGLAAVLGIVRGHGGAVRLRSEPGKGTRFDVLLPASGERAAAQRPGETAEGGKGTVLVVDDEAAVRMATARMLSSLGYDVLEAADGERAVNLFRLRGGDLDAVVLDLTMPGLSGEETLTLLREIDADACVVVFSGYAEDHVAARLGPLRPDAILHKPFTRQELAAALQAALAREREFT